MKKASITFDLPEELAKWVKRTAKAQGSSVSEVVRGAIRVLRTWKENQDHP